MGARTRALDDRFAAGTSASTRPPGSAATSTTQIGITVRKIPHDRDVNRECRDGLDPNEQDPIAGGGGEGSQMAVLGAKQPFLFELPTFVKLRGSEYLFFAGR